MAKSKKTKQSAAKPKIKVRDLKPKKDPKGGALNAYLKLESPAALKLDTAGLKIDSTGLKLNSLTTDYKFHK